ncbi:unnamed protein product [Acanthosepion pharaonis]|uniref:NADH dehydrogenase subunit 2 n=1 Tax=Acanthosepion pharaonis TaxID=158019 RepID=A0A812AW07_ACAPH|nr:unnamed protein product [Sepia pharaonis]
MVSLSLSLSFPSFCLSFSFLLSLHSSPLSLIVFSCFFHYFCILISLVFFLPFCFPSEFSSFYIYCPHFFLICLLSLQKSCLFSFLIYFYLFAYLFIYFGFLLVFLLDLFLFFLSFFIPDFFFVLSLSFMIFFLFSIAILSINSIFTLLLAPFDCLCLFYFRPSLQTSISISLSLSLSSLALYFWPYFIFLSFFLLLSISNFTIFFILFYSVSPFFAISFLSLFYLPLTFCFQPFLCTRF